MGRESVGIIKSRRERLTNYDLENHKEKRRQKNIATTLEHSLGHDVTIAQMEKQNKIGTPKIFKEGSIAVIDDNTNKLLVCFCYVDFTDPDQNLSSECDHAISTYYHHGLARQLVAINASHNKMG